MARVFRMESTSAREVAEGFIDDDDDDEDVRDKKERRRERKRRRREREQEEEMLDEDLKELQVEVSLLLISCSLVYLKLCCYSAQQLAPKSLCDSSPFFRCGSK